MRAGRYYIFINLEVKLTHDTICHELYHAISGVLEDKGIEAGEDNHEPFAYLQGYVAQKIYGAINRWGIKIN